MVATAVSGVVWVALALFGVSQVSATIIQRGGLTSGRFNCLIDPCQVTQCFAYPDATCVADFEQGCNAKFYLGRNLLAPGECGIARRTTRGRILNDDTEREGSPPTRTRTRSAPPSPNSRVTSNSRPPTSSTRNRSRNSRPPLSQDEINRRKQHILAERKRMENARARAIMENEIRTRQRQQQQQRSRSNSGRQRSQSSRSRSRGSSRMGNSRPSQSSRSRSRSSSRRRGFLGRLMG